MVVWGGAAGPGAYFNDGANYDPNTDTWTNTSITNAPDARIGHTAVWTGSEMVVWGGGGDAGMLNTGGKHNPTTNSWTATSVTNAPSGRLYHTTVWTGSEMVVWGGSNGAFGFSTPAEDTILSQIFG
jgi:N-acetylneuraminic acid mutarotase